MTWVMIDFETTSNCDLKTAGAWRYAEDVSTEVLCLSYSVDGGPAVSCSEEELASVSGPAVRLHKAASDPSIIFIAHNCSFEKAVWRSIMVSLFHWPPIPAERWHDSLAVCAYKALPLDLDHACRILRVPQTKDTVASRFTVSLSRPRDGMMDRSAPTLARAMEYCNQDVRTQVEVHKRLRGLPASERRVWLLDQKINERGVRLDLPFIAASQRLVDEATEPLAKECLKLTGGVTFTQVAKLKEWCNANGAHLKDLQKGTVDRLLGGEIDALEAEEAAGDEGEEDDLEATLELPEAVRRVLSIRRLVGSASVKKLHSMQACVCEDGRARGLMQYHGAATGRWAGRLIQVQNFPRGTIEIDGHAPEPAEIKRAIMTCTPEEIEMLWGPPVETVLSALRHAIIPGAGKTFVCADYASIEARVVLALAGEHERCREMAAGLDVYCSLASSVYHRPITKEHDKKERKVGKEGVLGCGFGMGPPKFRRRVYQNTGILLTREEAKGVITTYREDFAPGVPKLWWALEEAALETVRTGVPHAAYGVEYAREAQWLSARLPSGRKIWYFNPQLVRRPMPWDETDVRWAWTFQAKKQGKWLTIAAYGGLLTENVVQATARDLLAHGLLTVEENGYEVVMTVHDEALSEVDEGREDVHAYEQMMSDRPAWAVAMGIPVAAEGWAGKEYRK